MALTAAPATAQPTRIAASVTARNHDDGLVASLSTRFFRTRPVDPSEERVRRYLETAVTRP